MYVITWSFPLCCLHALSLKKVKDRQGCMGPHSFCVQSARGLLAMVISFLLFQPPGAANVSGAQMLIVTATKSPPGMLALGEGQAEGETS